MIRDFENTWPMRRVEPLDLPADLAQRARERQGDDADIGDPKPTQRTSFVGLGLLALSAVFVVYVLAMLLSYLWGPL